MKLTKTPQKAILIRIGVDQSFGNWNAPCNPENNDYTYVPIPQEPPVTPSLAKIYKDSMPHALSAFSDRNSVDIQLPEPLLNQPMHLDPDYDYLSYGDTTKRGKNLLNLEVDDWVVFYSGLRSIYNSKHLVYALTGLLVVKSVRQTKDIPTKYYHQNAHTRVPSPEPSDIVVTGKKDISGRFKQYIDIGEFRSGSYRVRKALLDSWGDLTVNDGWIQRSANPPLFKNPEQFAGWLKNMNPELLEKNN